MRQDLGSNLINPFLLIIIIFIYFIHFIYLFIFWISQVRNEIWNWMNFFCKVWRAKQQPTGSRCSSGRLPATDSWPIWATQSTPASNWVALSPMILWRWRSTTATWHWPLTWAQDRTSSPTTVTSLMATGTVVTLFNPVVHKGASNSTRWRTIKD